MLLIELYGTQSRTDLWFDVELHSAACVFELTTTYLKHCVPSETSWSDGESRYEHSHTYDIMIT